MSIETLVAAPAVSAPLSAGGGAAGAVDFSAVLAKARAARLPPPAPEAPASGGLLEPLLNLNTHSQHLADSAQQAAATEMRPSELMMLTVQSHEFLFHSQLVSNVANRSADGVQQLFRQQS